MKKILIILLLFLFVPLLADTSSEVKAPLRLNASYYGEVILHPGMTIGLDYSFIQFNRAEIHFNVELGGYYHKWYQKAYFENLSFGFRYRPKNSFFIDPQLNFAFFITEPDGDIYTTSYFDEYPYYPVAANLKFGLALMFGWGFNDLPIELFFGPDIYLESKVNNMLIPHFALKIGVAYAIGGKK